MYKERLNLYKQLEEELNTKLLVYITSDRMGLETQIGQDVIELFINQLESIGYTSKLSLYLYTRGGDTAAAWNIINLLRQYCDELEVIIPHKAHSAGTLISIGADSIIMTRQATLSPIDPSVNTPLNPINNNDSLPNTIPVSVEAVKGYLALAKEELNIEDGLALSNIMMKLSDAVHPLVLGQVYRARAQIKMLAEKLLVHQVNDEIKIKNIISFLCSDSGSHDYTINSKEAKEYLGLNIKMPNDKLYSIIKEIYDDINKELEFSKPFDPISLAQMNMRQYSVNRALIESIYGGRDAFVTEGEIIIINNKGQQQVNLTKTFENWIHQ